MRERTALSEQVRVVTADSRTLESAARIMDGHRASLRLSKPRATSDNTQLSLERGALTKAVLEVLRDAKQPLTVMEIGQAALARLDLQEYAMTRSMLATKVIASTTSRVRKGTLRRVEREGELLRLEVAR